MIYYSLCYIAKRYALILRKRARIVFVNIIFFFLFGVFFFIIERSLFSGELNHVNLAPLKYMCTLCIFKNIPVNDSDIFHLL